MSALDAAHAAMMADPEDEAARRDYYGLIAASELYLLLEAEPQADHAAPLVLETEDGKLALAFDSDVRLGGFVEAPMPHLVLSGRAIVGMLAGQGIGVAINPGAETDYVLTGDVLDWMREAASESPDLAGAMPDRLFAPKSASQAFLKALDQRLAMLAGVVRTAWLGEDTEGGLVLVLTGVTPERQGAVAALMAEARNFAAPEHGLGVVFAEGGAALETRLANVALRFDLPQPPEPPAHKAPGTDPERPPRLR